MLAVLAVLGLAELALRAAPGGSARLLTEAARDGPRVRGDGQTGASGGAPGSG